MSSCFASCLSSLVLLHRHPARRLRKHPRSTCSPGATRPPAMVSTMSCGWQPLGDRLDQRRIPGTSPLPASPAAGATASEQCRSSMAPETKRAAAFRGSANSGRATTVAFDRDRAVGPGRRERCTAATAIAAPIRMRDPDQRAARNWPLLLRDRLPTTMGRKKMPVLTAAPRQRTNRSYTHPGDAPAWCAVRIPEQVTERGASHQQTQQRELGKLVLRPAPVRAICAQLQHLPQRPAPAADNV